jgi:hypothetical protein
MALDVDAVLLHPVDNPLVAAASVGAVLEALGGGARIAVPSHAGRRGHPAGFARAAWPALQAAPLEGGARSLLAEHPDWVVHVPAGPDCLADIDTKEEEAAFRDASRVFSNPDMATPCNFTAALANPINTAWREGSEFNRANFVRLYLDDILKVAEQVKLSDQPTNQPNDDDLDIPASPRLPSPGPTP